MNSSSKTSFLLHLLLLAVFITSTSMAGFLIHMATVTLTDDLESGLNITLQCKSKNTDLGVQFISYHNYFQFRFRPNFWGRTDYFCWFKWATQVYWFDVYISNRDRDFNELIWMIREKGPCMYNAKSGEYDRCFPWNEG